MCLLSPWFWGTKSDYDLRVIKILITTPAYHKFTLPLLTRLDYPSCCFGKWASAHLFPPLSLLPLTPPPRKITRPDAREWRNFEFIIRHQAYDFQQHKYLGSSGNLDLWSFVTIFQNVDNINGDLAKNISENSVSLAYMTRDKFCGLLNHHVVSPRLDLNNEMPTSSIRLKNLIKQIFHSPLSIQLGHEIWSLPFINQKNKNSH